MDVLCSTSDNARLDRSAVTRSFIGGTRLRVACTLNGRLFRTGMKVVIFYLCTRRRLSASRAQIGSCSIKMRALCADQCWALIDENFL